MIVNIKEMTRLWNDKDIRNDELAGLLGVRPAELHILKKRFGLPARYYRAPPQDDLPLEEIRRRAEEIRKGWSAEERERRLVGRTSRRWRPPAYDYDHKRSVFQPLSQ